jgi:hypothetical protein
MVHHTVSVMANCVKTKVSGAAHLKQKRQKTAQFRRWSRWSVSLFSLI